MTKNPKLRPKNRQATIRTPNYELQDFMQNKPNFLNNQMNITFYLKTCYEHKTFFLCLQNKPNSNPIKPKQTQSHHCFWPKNRLRIYRTCGKRTRFGVFSAKLYKKILIFGQIHPLFLRFFLIFCRNFVITVDR